MTSASTVFRSLLIYSICLPLAVVLGYQMGYLTTSSFTIVGAVLALLVVPLLLRWHHAWLVATWNMGVVVFFLPGTPSAWMVVAWLSLLVAVLQFTLNRRLQFLPAPTLTRPMIFLVIVVLATARLTGGIGLQSMGGGTIGGKRYIMLLTSVVGYFALTSQRIQPERALYFVAWFFAGTITIAISDFFSVFSPSLYFIFLLIPPSSSGVHLYLNPSASIAVERLGSLAAAAMAMIWYMLARFGIEDIFTWRRLGRVLIFLMLGFVSMMGGFRSTVILILLTFLVLFYLEGLLRSRLMPGMTFVAVLGMVLMFAFASHLPQSVQRSVSFVPYVPIDPMVKLSAQSSTDWRLEMWRRVWPEVGDYLWLGKGYGMNASDFQLLRMDSGTDSGTHGAEMAGDYHNGPLSVIITFGIAGAIGLVWLLIAGLKVLHRNYLYGDPRLKMINRFLLASFVAKTVFFLAIFGSFYSDLSIFTGLLGMSVCLNGGVAGQEVPEQPKLVYNKFRIPPGGLRRPIGA